MAKGSARASGERWAAAGFPGDARRRAAGRGRASPEGPGARRGRPERGRRCRAASGGRGRPVVPDGQDDGPPRPGAPAAAARRARGPRGSPAAARHSASSRRSVGGRSPGWANQCAQARAGHRAVGLGRAPRCAAAAVGIGSRAGMRTLAPEGRRTERSSSTRDQIERSADGGPVSPGRGRGQRDRSSSGTGPGARGCGRSRTPGSAGRRVLMPDSRLLRHRAAREARGGQVSRCRSPRLPRPPRSGARALRRARCAARAGRGRRRAQRLPGRHQQQIAGVDLPGLHGGEHRAQGARRPCRTPRRVQLVALEPLEEDPARAQPLRTARRTRAVNRLAMPAR